MQKNKEHILSSFKIFLRKLKNAKGGLFVFYWIIDFAFQMVPCNRNNNVCIVRLDAIGDFILWLDSAKIFRKIYPDQKIVLIANSAWADFARELPYWDDVWDLDTKKFVRDIFYRWKFLLKVRRAGFSTAIQPTYSRTFMHGDSVIRATGAGERIGSVSDLSNISKSAKKVSDGWYTRLVDATTTPLMELYRNTEFISNLTEQIHHSALPQIRCKEEGLDFGLTKGEYFVLFPGASWSGKRWPADKFADLARLIYGLYGKQAVLCGSPADIDLCNKVVERANVPCVDVSGKTSLMQLAEIIRGALFLVSNDTSAVHIATAVGTPSVCILGGGHFGRFLPYPSELTGTKPVVAAQPMDCFNCNWRCVYSYKADSPVPCIEQISVELVLNRIQAAVQLEEK